MAIHKTATDFSQYRLFYQEISDNLLHFRLLICSGSETGMSKIGIGKKMDTFLIHMKQMYTVYTWNKF